MRRERAPTSRARLITTGSFQGTRNTGSAVPPRIACSCARRDGMSLGACSPSMTIQSKPAPAMISAAIGLQSPLHSPIWRRKPESACLNALRGKFPGHSGISPISSVHSDRSFSRRLCGQVKAPDFPDNPKLVGKQAAKVRQGPRRDPKPEPQIRRSRSVGDRLDQSANVPIAECKGLQRARISLRQRNMIGHKHVGVTDLLVNLDCFDKVNIAFVRKDLNKIVPVSANVAEVDVEDFFANAKISNHIKNLHRWVFEIFRDGSLAEVKPVVSTLLYGDESLEPVEGTQHPVYALIAFRRHSRILRMTSHSNFVLIGHRNHAVEKIRNALPEGVCIHVTGLGERRCRMSFGEIPHVVHGIATARYAPGAKDTENAHVVLDGWNAGQRTILDEGL